MSIIDRQRHIYFQVGPSRHTESGYYVGVMIDNGYTVRTNGFASWIGVMRWLEHVGQPVLNHPIVTLDNYTLHVRSIRD